MLWILSGDSKFYNRVLQMIWNWLITRMFSSGWCQDGSYDPPFKRKVDLKNICAPPTTFLGGSYKTKDNMHHHWPFPLSHVTIPRTFACTHSLSCCLTPSHQATHWPPSTKHHYLFALLRHVIYIYLFFFHLNFFLLILQFDDRFWLVCKEVIGI